MHKDVSSEPTQKCNVVSQDKIGLEMSYGQDRSVTVAITASWSTPGTQVLTEWHGTCDGMDRKHHMFDCQLYDLVTPRYLRQ